MRLLSVKSSFPERSWRQDECLSAMRGAVFWPELHARSRWLLEKVLSGDNGIEKRHFCLENVDDAWSRDAQELSETYEREAPKLAAVAVEKALAAAGLEMAEIDAILVCSCTGYLCPGLSSYVAEILGLRADVLMEDMTGFGCGAVVPLLRSAAGVVALNPDAVVVTVAVEVCSAAFFVEDDFGVLISTCLFGDGAAAAVWSGKGGAWEIGDFESLHFPAEREKIRFTNAGGKLRNQLARSVPKLAGETVGKLYAKRNREPQEWITHGGGRDVIDELEKALGADLAYARGVMRDYGNLSSPSMLVALERFLADERTEVDQLWLCAFGAGFSAHSCEMRRVW